MAAEKNFENRVKNYLKEQGVYFIKYWGGAAYTKSGIPDVLACCNGQFMGVEIKAPKGKPSELQIYNLRQIDQAGGLAILLYPDDFELFKALVETVQEYGDSTRGMMCYTVLVEKWKHFEHKFNQRKE